MRGRKPAPTHLKILRGNPGKRKLPTAEPRGAQLGVKPPAHLSDESKAHWSYFAELLRCAETTDAAALELLCDLYVDYHVLRNIIGEQGRTVTSVTKYGTCVKAHPAVTQLNQVVSQFRGVLAEFGMTPSSRTKVKAAPIDAADPYEAYLNSNKKA